MKKDDECSLFLLANGEVEKYIDENHVYKIQEKRFFAEEQLVTNSPTTFKYTALTDITVHKISNETIKNIPSIYWQLFESYRKTIRSL
jgi:CRP-like cAMP-binding protein